MKDLDVITGIPETIKAVAFTFDDGPNPQFTPEILEIFRKVNGQATFFMVGKQMEEYPEVAATVHSEGHELANHTYTHPYLTRISPDEARLELVRTEDRIKSVTGKPVHSFRAPYLDTNDYIASLAAELGYRSIGAVNLETLDWKQPGVDYILEHTRKHIQSGSVLLFHDGAGDRSQSVEAVRILLAELAEEGYQFVTVSELAALAEQHRF